MDLGYAGRVALVTGGTRGIGLSIARALLDEGCAVAISGTSTDSVSHATARLDAGEGRLVGLVGNLSERGTASRLVEEAVAACGRIDIVVNNAAGFTEGHFLESPTADWEALFALKLVGYLEVARAAVPLMRAQRSGCILNIAGIAGIRALPGSGHAGAVNAAVLNLTRLMALELAGDGIRVNALSPGSVNTDRMETRITMLMEQRGQSRAEVEALLTAKVPTGHPVDADEVATVAAMVCSPRLRSWVGDHIVVDGGVALS